MEASHVSISSLNSFRASIGRAVWSSKMPMASTPVLLNLLDRPVGVENAYRVIWARFSMLRRYLAYRLDEVPRVYRMLVVTVLSTFSWLLLLRLVLLGMGGSRVG